jgi:hypothetical protein
MEVTYKSNGELCKLMCRLVATFNCIRNRKYVVEKRELFAEVISLVTPQQKQQSLTSANNFHLISITRASNYLKGY